MKKAVTADNDDDDDGGFEVEGEDEEEVDVIDDGEGADPDVLVVSESLKSRGMSLGLRGWCTL